MAGRPREFHGGPVWMTGCRAWALIGLALIVALIGFVWWQWFPRYTYHQKITVTVEAGGKEYSASSVTAETWQFQPKILPEAGRASATLEGEAVHLDLPGGKHLFALMKIDPKGGLRGNGWMTETTGLATYVFPEAATNYYWPADMKRLRKIRDIPIEVMPLLVTFNDLSKPETVRKVNPWSLASTFGEGIALKSVTLAIVDEPVGPGTIRATLPWLSDFPEPALQSGKIIGAPTTFAQTLNHGAFFRRGP